MKRYISIAFAITIILFFAGCHKKQQGPKGMPDIDVPSEQAQIGLGAGEYKTIRANKNDTEVSFNGQSYSATTNMVMVKDSLISIDFYLNFPPIKVGTLSCSAEQMAVESSLMDASQLPRMKMTPEFFSLLQGALLGQFSGKRYQVVNVKRDDDGNLSTLHLAVGNTTIKVDYIEWQTINGFKMPTTYLCQMANRDNELELTMQLNKINIER